VVGIAAGFKFRGGRRAGAPAVQFFVERKVSRPPRALPGFVLSRDARGRAIRSSRIPTDVIAARSPRFTCGSGASLRAFGERGSLALLFRDRSGGADRPSRATYLLTCAHVAGDLERSPPLSPALRLGERPEVFARVLKNCLAARGVVEYDVALAEVVEGALPVRDLEIRGGGRVAGWLDPGEILLGSDLELSAASGRRRGPLESIAGEFLVYLDGRPYRVQNLWGLRVEVRDGDSGGLVHRRGRAAGMVVARSSGGFAWWQPLRPALLHLNGCRPRTRVQPFPMDEGRRP